MNINIVDEATNTVMTENGPISLDTAPKFKAVVRPKKVKKPTKVAQILALSEKGMAPREISKILGVKLHYVYTARAHMKAKGVGRWHQVPDTLQPKVTIVPWEQQEAEVRRWAEETRLLNLQPAPAKPEPFSLPFFSRIKAAYAALKGEVK